MSASNNGKISMPRIATTALLTSFALAALPGCQFDEGLIINNMYGTVLVPEEAATKTFVDLDGNEQTLTHPANIGPVYVGVFPAVQPADVLASYPHPEIGPIYLDGVNGDTYPYGGTTVGDIRFPCFQSLRCKLISGRFQDYDELVEWYNGTLGQPIVDADGREVDNGTYFQQTCWDLLEVTSDEEVRLTSYDQDRDGELGSGEGLDFFQNADGDFEAEFILRQQEYFWDQNQENCEAGTDCTGFSLWAYMDGPADNSGTFSTCNATGQNGFEVEEYNYDFFGGRVESDVLNQPGNYIGEGDWVANGHVEGGTVVDGAYVWENIYDRPVIRLGHEVQ